jgi:hypothetical protein
MCVLYGNTNAMNYDQTVAALEALRIEFNARIVETAIQCDEPIQIRNISWDRIEPNGLDSQTTPIHFKIGRYEGSKCNGPIFGLLPAEQLS